MRVAVVGHVEWTRLAHVEQVPNAGGIAHASMLWEGPAGGGAVAAVQMAKLAGECDFFTALGDDRLGALARDELQRHGVSVKAGMRLVATCEAVSLVDQSRERTTITLGERLAPIEADLLPWEQMIAYDAVFFVSGDCGAARAARAAEILVATSRELATIAGSGVHLDALVGSANDPAERYDPDMLAADPPDLVVVTDGANGGTYHTVSDQDRYDAADLPGSIVDTYGVGDSFAATLTFALGRRNAPANALAMAARAGAACACGRGPFAGQVGAANLDREPWGSDGAVPAAP